MLTILGTSSTLFLIALTIYLLTKKKYWLSAIIVVFLILIPTIFTSIIMETDKTETSTTSENRGRVLLKTITIPGNSTVAVPDMYYVYYNRKKWDRVIVEVIEGPYENLFWMNPDLPDIQVKKKKTIFYACPPGAGKKNKIIFKNKGEEEIKIGLRIIAVR